MDYTTLVVTNFSPIVLAIAAMALFAVGTAFWILYFLGFFYKRGQGPTLEALSKQSYKTIYGHKVYYTQDGQGEHVLLLHGIGASHYVWRFLVPEIAKSHTVTAVDLLGFGLSDKPNTFKYDLDSQCDMILEILRELNIQKCTVIGSSMGGTIALRLSQLRPDIFQRIIVMSPAADPRITFFDLNRVSFLSPVVSPLVKERFVKQIMRLVYAEKKLITDDNIKIYTEPYASNPLAIDSFVKSFSLLRDRRVHDELEKIKNPVLIIWGKKDRIISSRFATKIQKKIPHSALEIHESGGHHIQEEHPEWVLSKIISFLKN